MVVGLEKTERAIKEKHMQHCVQLTERKETKQKAQHGKHKR
jgi:hypothetical protein